MTTYRQQSSHWGLFTAAGTPDGLDVIADPGDPDPAPLLRNVPAALDERVRVLAPHVRKGWLEGRGVRGRDEYVQVSWAEAVELAAGELDRVRRTHGNEAIYGGSYGWGSAGRFHHAQSQIHRFLNVIGGYTRSVNSYSLGAATPLLRHVVGSEDPIGRPTAWPVLAEHTEHFVCFGGIAAKNSQVNSGGISRHSVAGHLRRAWARGARFTLVGPLRDDLAAELDAEWLAPVPGTDAALMLALCHVLIERGWHAEEFLRTHCEGFEEFWKYLSGAADGTAKSPQWAEEICGIDAAAIVRLAESMATRRTMVTLSWSLQRARHGEQPLWAGIALACVLGQIGLPGGGFGHGYGSMAGIGVRPLPYRLPKLPQGVNPVRQFIPVARIADMLLNPGQEYEYDGERRTYPDIRLVYWAGGNPFHHHQDLTRLAEAFNRPEAVIVHDPFWTATARHADIVFPATTTLERNDLGCAREDRALVAMRQVVPPLGEARSDFEIFAALADKLGLAPEFTEGRDERAWLEHMYEQWRQNFDPGLDFAQFWEIGRLDLPGEPDDQVLYDRFRADPVGNPLPTPSGRIELFSQRIDSFGYADCPGHPAWLVPEELQVPPGSGEFPLFLVANNPATRLHSQLDHGATSADSKVHDREPMRVHPADAAARGLSTGDIARVVSATGSALAAVLISDEVRPGVVQLSTGAWFDPSAPEVATCIHGNPNAVTRDIGTSSLAQGCTGQLTRVEVRRHEDPPPPLRAYDPPVETG
ncbi:biotin/methionine sulfoxide reductase [Saccharopolyspora shandongensis]|uniref:Biotin/methionine sulfoxide reductase n=1 Tax=Saccharopolyspora shandongensis TaxID=418495 RepID=A0A1H3MZZ4_9PSEU|nr:molybdopterin-dependent oxidoreductase [Saccharopolyspora shandongensis]SDY81559.1 biotin/methionine sulfoxide reductase [Saccharopolyspora shandongensis]